MGKIQIQLISVFVTVLVFYTCNGLTTLQGHEILFRDDNDSNNEDPVVIGCQGECVDIRTCLILLAIVANRTQHEYLKQTQCGWNQSIPMVCCDSNWNCSTPLNRPGYCIPFTSCPDMKATALQLPSPQESIKYIKDHRCSSMELNVCCSTLPTELNNKADLTDTTTQGTEVAQCGMADVSPEWECCGRETSSNRIIGGEVTAIDQYPWAAALEYAVPGTGRVAVSCGGTLISRAYVVTAAHCVFKMEPLNVRLGDYDIDNPGMDCVAVEGGGEDCTDEAVIIPIEEITMHPNYAFNSSGHANDIALLKLIYPAPYTDFIRPICLPTSDFTETATSKLELKVAGWGVTDDKRSHSPIKRHVGLPYVNQEDCFDLYMRANVHLGEGQICAGGVKGKDSCKGDSGGGLMQIKDQTTEIVGVTSFGFLPCGQEDRPAVYTKIFNYLSWIRSIID